MNYVRFTVNEQGAVTAIDNSTVSAVGMTNKENGAYAPNQKDPG